ncbi:MAG: DNA-binding response regulator [Rhizobacter sp.]|nr:DNA-binding response regulator [Ferruginibacter sp.]
MIFLKKYKTLIIYSISLALLFLLLKLGEYRLLIIDHSFEIYAGSIALLFLLLGIWLSRRIFAPKKEISIIETEKIVEKQVFITAPVPFVLNEKALSATDISSRELEVLELIAKGMSNQEIAGSLFLSVSTIKTHIANLFFKLEVTRRTQAVEKAKKLSIIP